MAGPGTAECLQCSGAGRVEYTEREVEQVARAIALSRGRAAYDHREYRSAAIEAIKALDRERSE